MKRDSSVWNNYQTHMRVRIDERNLKTMNVTHFHPKITDNFGKNTIAQ